MTAWQLFVYLRWLEGCSCRVIPWVCLLCVHCVTEGGLGLETGNNSSIDEREDDVNRADIAAADDASVEELGLEDEDKKSGPSPVRFVKRQVNRVRLLSMCSEGFSLRGARTWIRRTRSDWRHRTVPSSDVRSAHKRGFSVNQVRRFDVDALDASTCLSEREYDLLFPMSGRYGKWVDDRVTSRLVAGPLAERFETMHFNIISRNGELLFIPLSDEARAYAHDGAVDRDGFLAFCRDLGARPECNLSVTGSAWSSRYSLRIEPDGKRFVCGEDTITADELLERISLRAARVPLVVYEVAPKDASLAALQEGCDKNLFGSIRLTLCNSLGNDPFVADAYMRILAREASDMDEDQVERVGEQMLDAEELQDAESEEQEQQDPIRYYAAPISLEDGTFDGARAMLPYGNYRDVETIDGADLKIRGTVAHWDEIMAYVVAYMKRMPQVEFLEMSIRSFEDGFAVVRLNSFPSFNRAFPLPADVQAFLKQKAADKRELGRSEARQRVSHAAFLRWRRSFTKLLFPAGMVYYQGLRYPHDVIEDLFSSNGIKLSRKLWGYRHGFLSYRLDLYPELGEDNWQSFVTDFEYRWLRHINPKYRAWMEDKITIKYVLSEFGENLPAYYYFTSCRAGENRIVPMMDCPEGYGNTIEDILRLTRELGVLALKPDEGSHGEGFYKLSYEDGAYKLNGEPTTEDHVVSILRDPNNQYLVTEYLELHPQLKEIYPGAVNSVRVTVFKKDGVHPQIGNAYFRIGSTRTGAVDNVVAGGLVAEVDVTTGHYGNARTLVDNRIVFESNHPDTGVLIEGTLPHWDYIRERVLKIAASVPQLEYMGFDVAITEQGFKLLEVNRYPDYPRISRLTPETIDYLLMKIADKKRFCDIEHNHSLFKLPRRDA